MGLSISLSTSDLFLGVSDTVLDVVYGGWSLMMILMIIMQFPSFRVFCSNKSFISGLQSSPSPPTRLREQWPRRYPRSKLIRSSECDMNKYNGVVTSATYLDREIGPKSKLAEIIGKC